MSKNLKTPPNIQADIKLQSLIDDGELPGLAVQVNQIGRPIYQFSTGYRDIVAKRPMQADTIVQIFSMTKALVSTGVLQLWEQGKLDLDDDIEKWTSIFAETPVVDSDSNFHQRQNPITIRQLLTHTAGLSYGGDEEYGEKRHADNDFMLRRDLTTTEMVKKVAKFPLLAEPGNLWNYSFSTDVLGYLIELVTGQSLREYIQQHVTGPLGMLDTDFTIDATRRDRLATLYEPKQTGELQVMMTSDAPLLAPETVNCYSGGGGLLSTLNDYIKFADCLTNGGQFDGGQLIRKETWQEMTRNHVAERLLPLSYNGVDNPIMDGFGFGLGVRVHLDPQQTGVPGPAGTFGWGGMASTLFICDPINQVSAVCMTQRFNWEVHKIRPIFRDVVYNNVLGIR